MESLSECCLVALYQRIVLGKGCQHADASHPLALLRARRERPRSRAAEQRDELAALHSTTSSARADKSGGTSIPICLAVFRFITNSNLLDCMTGKSAGLSPLRIRAT